LKWTPPGSPFPGFVCPENDCGIPKFDRPAVTAEVEQSYAFAPPVFEVPAEDESAQPLPTPAPIYPGEYSGNVFASLSDLSSLISPPSDPNDIVVSVRGFASADADSVSVDIDTYASPSTVSPASIDTIVAGLRRLPLHATIDESPGALIFISTRPHAPRTRADGYHGTSARSRRRPLRGVKRPVILASRRRSLAPSLRTPARRSRLALEDAIARARVDLAKRGFAAHAVRLVYAVRRPRR
jgi:hypothetical protein